MRAEFREYVTELSDELKSAQATEHTYRPALKRLIQSLHPAVTATNEPVRKRIVGAPDMSVRRGQVPLGYIECKDVGKDLAAEAETEQLERYRDHLPNLLLTDYVEFRWYVDGEHKRTARLGDLNSQASIDTDSAAVEQVAQLLRDFVDHTVPTISTPKELAVRMARQAHACRQAIIESFRHEVAGGSLHNLLDGFRDTLLPELTPEDFADMYAQTIAYGLFAARVNHSGKAHEFDRRTAGYELPKTNPFLRKLFFNIAGPDLDESIAWIADELAHLLGHAEMDAVLRDFGRRKRGEDPVVHFYETFLAEFDPDKRKDRGVYYTPEPVVGYIVRSVDKLLQEHFDKPSGLADPGVMILDPACGTGTFLHAVIDHVRDKFTGQEGAWSSYVAEHLLPRIFGFEIMMAPYSVAHMKLGLQLRETGYDFGSEERLGVYLTNTLEQAARKSDQMFGQFISDEADAAAEIKGEKPIMVVLGNPPYSGHSYNQGEWIDNLLKKPYDIPGGGRRQGYYTVDGAPLGEQNPKWLQDDYVKFIRFGQWRIDRTGHGILAFITNHGYLDNPTFRGMRQSLMRTFDEMYLYDLHGNAKKQETCPDGSKDENVFDQIMQGVAICLMVKQPDEGD